MEQLLTHTGKSWVFPTPEQIQVPGFVPQAIAQAIMRAIRLPDFSLGPVHRLALCVIVGFADKEHPGQPIYIRKTVLGQYIGRSLAQLRRYLADLEEDGWIERAQHISRAAGAQVGSITLTQKSLAAFFPKEPKPTKPAFASEDARPDRPVDNPPESRRSSMSDAIQDSPSKQCLRRHLAREGSCKQTENPQQNRTQAIWRVPEPLRWLCEQAKVSPWGVFGLMKRARERGTTLEVVLRCIRKSIDGARNAYAYISRVLSEDRDWNQYAAWVEARQQARAAKAAEDRIRAERLRNIQQFSGQAFRHNTTGRIYEVYGETASVFEGVDQWKKGASMGGCPALRIIELIESGLLSRCA